MPADTPSPERHGPPLANTSPVWRRAWHPVAHAEDIAGDAPTQVLAGGDAPACPRGPVTRNGTEIAEVRPPLRNPRRAHHHRQP
jgi:hypothetical protein